MAFLWGLVAVLILALRGAILRLAAAGPACPIRHFTGIPCPSCGSGHATLALLKGEIPAAFSANPLAAAGILVLLAGGLAAPAWNLAGGPVPRVPVPLPRAWRAAGAVLLLANWVYLILTATPSASG